MSIRRQIVMIGTLCICLIGAALRVFYAWDRLLWLDEIQTIIYIHEGFHFLVGIADQNAVIDVHPPFYYVLLWIWSQLSQSDMWLRLLSIIIGVASLPLLFAVIWELEIRKGMVPVTLLLAFSVPHIIYSAEIRMYSLTVFLTLLSMFLYLVWYRNNRWWSALLWLIITSSGCYTYHFFIFIPLTQGIHCLITSVYHRGRLFRFAVMAALLFVTYIPGLQKLMSQAAFVSNDYWGLSPSIRELFGLLFWYAAGNAFRGNTAFQWALAGSWLLLFVLGWFSKELTANKKILLALWFFMPPLVVFILSQRTPLFQYRYFLPGLPVFLLMMGIRFTSLRRTATKLLFAGIVSITGLVALLVNWQHPERIDMKSIIEHIDESASSREVVFHLIPSGGSGETFVISRYYRPEWQQWIVGTIEDISREARPSFSTGDFVPKIDRRLVDDDYFWCVVMQAFISSDVEKRLVAASIPRNSRIVSHHSFHLVSSYRCCFDPPE